QAQPASGVPLSVTGSFARWHVSGPSWARFSATTGTGAASVTVTADPANQSLGTSASQVVVADDASGQSVSLPISIDLRAAALTANPTSLSFLVESLTPAGGLTRPVTISDELG